MSAIDRITAEPLLLSPTYRGMAADLSRAPEEFDHALELAAVFGTHFDDGMEEKPFTFTQGIAYIPVRGTLINRSTASYSFLTGYNGMLARVQAACADPEVQGVVLDIDSHGGEVAGCFETAQAARAALTAAGKPSVAVVDSVAYSAAYAWACVADRIVLTPSGGAGSIGAVQAHASYAKQLEHDGIEITYVFAGDHKVDGNWTQALPDNVRRNMQASINLARDAFVAHVVAMRSLDTQAVLDTQAQIYRSAEALALGLVDAVAPAPEALTAFLDTLPATFPVGSQTLEAHMPDTNDAAIAERTRVKAILTHAEAAGRGELANHLAFDTQMTAEAATALLAKAAKEQAPAAAAPAPTAAANPLAAAMAAAGTPGIQAEGGAEADVDVDPVEATIAAIRAMQRG